MSKQKRKPSFMSRVRSTFILIIAAVVIFLAALLGNIFPGLNDFKDGVLDKVGYYEVIDASNDSDTLEALAESDSTMQIFIEKDSIYYMDKEISIEKLSDLLDENNFEYVVMVDKGATERCWKDVYSLLTDKNIAINKEFIK